MTQIPFLVRAGFLGLLALGCTLASDRDEQRATLTSVGNEALDRLPLVPRLVLAGLPSIQPEELWLVRGRVSEKEQAQILAAAPGDALSERRIPLSAWRSDRGIVMAPLVVLESSQEYSVVALSSGEVGRVATAPTPSSIWWRWGQGSVTAGGWVVYCAAEPPWSAELVSNAAAAGDGTMLGAHSLEPTGVEVEVVAGFSDASVAAADSSTEAIAPACVRFRAPEAPGMVLPPHRVGGRFFDPWPLAIEANQRAVEELEPSVRVAGSAAFLELPPGLAEFWLLGDAYAAGGAASGVLLRAQTATGASVPVGQLAPGRHRIAVTTLNVVGELQARTLTFEVKETEGYPVLSEVLANPLGAEPECEWVEVVNIGRAPLDLAGYVLEDAGGATELPHVTLQSGGAGLIVRRDFAAGASGDVVPAPDAIPVPVDELGDGGLSNTGEAIRLRAPDGALVSEIPAFPASAGQSVARRHLLAPDWITSFGDHAPPGASPGFENEVAR